MLGGAVEAEEASVDDGRRLHPGRGRGERAHRGGQLPRKRATEHRGAEGVRRVVPAQERERDSQTEAATSSSKRKVREDWNELSDFSHRIFFPFLAYHLKIAEYFIKHFFGVQVEEERRPFCLITGKVKRDSKIQSRLCVRCTTALLH